MARHLPLSGMVRGCAPYLHHLPIPRLVGAMPWDRRLRPSNQTRMPYTTPTCWRCSTHRSSYLVLAAIRQLPTHPPAPLPLPCGYRRTRAFMPTRSALPPLHFPISSQLFWNEPYFPVPPYLVWTFARCLYLGCTFLPSLGGGTGPAGGARAPRLPHRMVWAVPAPPPTL